MTPPNTDYSVVIVGAGDHGRSTLEILLAADDTGACAPILGFLDDAPSKHGSTIAGLPVLGGLEWVRTQPHGTVRYIIGIGDCRAKRAVAEQLTAMEVDFTSAIHPAAVIGRGVKVMPGAIINAGAVIAYDAVVEAHTTLNLNCTVGHDCLIGRYSTIAPGANLAGWVRVGEGCDVGLNATVGKGRILGRWSVVGPGAVILRDVAEGKRMFGNPARAVPGSAGIESRAC